MSKLENDALIERVDELGARAAAGTGIEVVQVDLRGAGKARLLRVYIDKEGGVTHGDCELLSHRLSELLDAEDVIPGDSYTLEVSSTGVERKLTRPRDFQRVVGQKIRVAYREGAGSVSRTEGVLTDFSEDTLTVATTGGEVVRVRMAQVQKANLKFEWRT